MFRKKGDHLRRQSVSLRGIQRGKGVFDVESGGVRGSGGFKSMRPNIPVTGAPQAAAGSLSKKSNNFREFIVAEFATCVSNFIARSKKENKQVLKDDKKWLKLLKSGGMDQIFKAKVCEQHFQKVFGLKDYFIQDFLRKFTKHVRGIVEYMCRQLFVKIDKTMTDYLESPEIIIEAIVKGYCSIYRGMEKFQFPLRCMRELISEYLFQHNGADMIRLLKTHFCDDDMQKKVLRGREFLFVERLGISDINLTLPSELIPYENAIKILNTMMNVVQIEKLVGILEKAFDAIFGCIDARNPNSEVKDVDISLVMAYCLLNTDIHKIPAYIEYIRVFMPRGRKTSVAMLFSDVMRWVVTSISIKMEYEEKRERERIMSSMSIEEQKKMQAKNDILEKIKEKKRLILEQQAAVQKKIEETKKEAADQKKKKDEMKLKTVKLESRTGMTEIPDDIETPKTAETSGVMELPMWGADDDDEEEVEEKKESPVSTEPKKENMVAGIDLGQYGVGDLSKYGVDTSPTAKIADNLESSGGNIGSSPNAIKSNDEILNNLDLSQYGITGLGNGASQASPTKNGGEGAPPSSEEVEDLKKKLEAKNNENVELGKHVLKLKKSLFELKDRYTKVVGLCKKLKEEKGGGGEEVKTLKSQLKKAITKIMELRKENHTLKDKVSELEKKN